MSERSQYIGPPATSGGRMGKRRRLARIIALVIQSIPTRKRDPVQSVVLSGTALKREPGSASAPE
jgi:hypothetical protein